jgi:hypothetical protein
MKDLRKTGTPETKHPEWSPRCFFRGSIDGQGFQQYDSQMSSVSFFNSLIYKY